MSENISSKVAKAPFLVWRQRIGLSRPEAARLLGRTTRQLFSYEHGRELPQTLLLSMAALEFLPSWRLNDLGITPFWRKGRR